MKYILSILMLVTVSAQAHTLSPPNPKAMVSNDQIVVKVKAGNLRTDVSAYDVVVVDDQELVPFKASARTFRLSEGNTRTITLFIPNDRKYKKLLVCTVSSSGSDLSPRVDVQSVVCVRPTTNGV